MSNMTGYILMPCQGQRKSHNAVFDMEMDHNNMYRLVLKVSSKNDAGIWILRNRDQLRPWL